MTLTGKGSQRSMRPYTWGGWFRSTRNGPGFFPRYGDGFSPISFGPSPKVPVSPICSAPICARTWGWRNGEKPGGARPRSG